MNRIKYILTSLLFLSCSLSAQIIVKPSTIFLEKELRNTFRDAKDYSQVMDLLNSLDTSRYEEFKVNIKILKSREINTFPDFQHYAYNISKIDWLESKVKYYHFKELLFGLLDHRLKEHKGQRNEMVNQMQAHVEEYENITGFKTDVLSFIKMINSENDGKSDLSNHISELLNSSDFTFRDYSKYKVIIKRKKEEFSYIKRLEEYTGPLIRSSTDYDGFYVQKSDSQFIEVLISEGMACHYVTGRYGLYFNYPQRWFTQEENISLVSAEIEKIILKGPRFNNNILHKAQFIKIERKRLGSHFFHCGNKIYKNGYAYTGMMDEQNNLIIPFFKKKSIDDNYTELYFPDGLSNGLYALFIEGKYYMFKIY